MSSGCSGGCTCATSGSCSKPGGCTCPKPKPAAKPAADSCSWRCELLRKASAAWRRGMRALAQGDAGEAEALQRQALATVFGLGSFPVLRARIHNNLGVILSCSGRAEEARREFSSALFLVRGRVDPQSRFVRVLQTNYDQTGPRTRLAA